MRIIDVLENEYEYLCEDCSSRIAFIEEDITTAEYGISCVICPKCSSKIILADNIFSKYEKFITNKNVEFPKDFYISKRDFSNFDINNPDFSNEKIKELINIALSHLKGNNEDIAYASNSNIGVLACRTLENPDHNNDIEIIVVNEIACTTLLRVTYDE